MTTDRYKEKPEHRHGDLKDLKTSNRVCYFNHRTRLEERLQPPIFEEYPKNVDIGFLDDQFFRPRIVPVNNTRLLKNRRDRFLVIFHTLVPTLRIRALFYSKSLCEKNSFLVRFFSSFPILIIKLPAHHFVDQKLI